MRRWIKATVVGGFAAAVVFMAYVAWSLGLFGSDLCGATVSERLPAPDRVTEAVVYEWNCGATTSFSSVVGVGAPGADPREGTRAFHIPGQPTRLESGSYGGPINPLFRVRWLAPTMLEIRYPASVRTFAKRTRVGKIVIQYVTD